MSSSDVFSSYDPMSASHILLILFWRGKYSASGLVKCQSHRIAGGNMPIGTSDSAQPHGTLKTTLAKMQKGAILQNHQQIPETGSDPAPLPISSAKAASATSAKSAVGAADACGVLVID